jgi:hypothetical protein
LIGYYLPDIQLSQRGRIEKISIKVAGSIYRACEQATCATTMVFPPQEGKAWERGCTFGRKLTFCMLKATDFI